MKGTLFIDMSDSISLPRFTLHDYAERFADRHLLHHVLAKWAKKRPEAPALLNADGSRTVNWTEFDLFTTAMAKELLCLGFLKGDFFITLLPMSIDHVLLEYSCFKIGVIVAPLDLRISSADLLRAIELLRPSGFACIGVNAAFDLRESWAAVQARCPWIQNLIAVDSAQPVPGTISFDSLADPAWRAVRERSTKADEDFAAVAAASSAVSETDGALVIFTTGSTGSPKPALLSHRGITVQNMCLSGAFFGGDSGNSMLVHVPPSHVGGQTELLMSTLFGGGTAVLLETFDAVRSLRAVAQHRIEIIGQIPAMFNLEWMLKDYDSYDLSSLKFALYGGNAVSRAFVDRVVTMAPVIGTGLGLTECSGFCTYVLADADEREQVLAGLGHDMPIYPCSIRQPMRDNGCAGDELPAGEIGHVCFRGPQTFLGYINDPAATAKAVSSDGYLYTGDLGSKDAKGLHLTGRAKWVIKPFGHQIYPGDVEAHIGALADLVASCVVVGVPHEITSEAVVAVVEKKPGADLSLRKLERHARTLAPYMRPRHWIILEPGKMPLNRMAKPDHLRIQELALEEIAHLRARGQWDRAYLSD